MFLVGMAIVYLVYINPLMVWLEGETQTVRLGHSDPKVKPPERIIERLKEDTYDPLFNPSKPKPCYKTYCFIFVCFVFCASTTGTIILWGTSFYHTCILKMITFEDGTFIYNYWKKPAVETIISIYPFNYTNIDRLQYEVPHVEELGPYVFRERMEKVNVVFNSNGTLTYSENRTHIFDEKATSGSLSDIIYTPNVPFISAAAAGSKRNIISQIGLAAILKGLDTRPFLPVAAEDFVMGFDDSFSVVARRISSILNGISPPKFGLLAGRVGLSSERVTIGTGIPNLDEVGVISAYDGVTSLNYWSTDDCNKITGGDGTLFPGNSVQYGSRLYIYVKGFCRRIPIEFYGEESINQEFPVKRFELPPTVFKFGPDDIENKCYCKDNASCPPMGTFSTAVCNFDAPMFVSYPHFLHGHPELRRNVSGMNPDINKHKFFLDIHRSLGIPIATKSRFQVSVQVNHCPFLSGLNIIPSGTLLPIAWVEVEMGEIHGLLKDLLYHATFTAEYARLVLSWTSLILAVASAIRLIFYLFYNR